MKLFSLNLLLLFGGHLLGQYQIGHTTITFNDPTRTGGFGSGGGSGRQIQTEIYYPGLTSGTNVAVAPGQHPIIVFGHGFAMAWDAYENIWQHYAEKGYILAFPRTEGSLFPSPSHQNFGLDLTIVEEKLRLLDNEPSSVFFEKINGNSAIMGHSMGGGASILASASHTSIKTVVGLAPAETTPSAITAAANVTVPALIFSGSKDGVTPPADHHIPIYDALGSACKTFVNITGGAHCYFAGTNFNCDFGESTSSSGISISRNEQQQLTYSILDPWLAYVLLDDCDAYEEYLTALTANSNLITQTTCSAGTSPVILNSNNLLTSSESGLSYQWYLNGTPIAGATSISHIATVAGEYVVKVFSDYGCSISEPLEINANAALTNMNAAEKLSVFPNPTNGLIHFDVYMPDPDALVTVYSVSGKLIKSVKYEEKVDISELNKGIYILKLNEFTTRIIKQ